MNYILEVKNLKKSYGDIEAVKDVSFLVKKGSLFAFLGPNGAGKSTTIKVITTLLNADTGEIYFNGKKDDVYIRNKIGVVFQDNILDNRLTVKENLIIRGSLYLSKNEVQKRYNELVEYLNLMPIENQRFETLSGGQKRRVEIARALFSNPEMLLLDEPTTGLDPETRKVVWNIIHDLKNNKDITVFLTTHYMEEAADADHIVIIDKGSILAEGTPLYLKNKYSNDSLKVVPINKDKLITLLNEKEITYYEQAGQYIITVNNVAETLEFINLIKDNIKQFEVIKGNMDDVFINVIEENKNEWFICVNKKKYFSFSSW